jgi:hypothetical protein
MASAMKIPRPNPSPRFVYARTPLNGSKRSGRGLLRDRPLVLHLERNAMLVADEAKPHRCVWLAVLHGVPREVGDRLQNPMLVPRAPVLYADTEKLLERPSHMAAMSDTKRP